MKEFIKDIKITKGQASSVSLAAIMAHIAAGFVAFIASRAIVLNSLAPFGLSILAGCPNVFTAAAATGAFLGYFFPAIEGGAFKYIAALFAVLSIKLLLSSYK